METRGLNADNHGMRGDEPRQTTMYAAVSMEQMVERQLAADHPLREIKRFTDAVLRDLSPDFDSLYAAGGRPSVAPELLLRALLWQALHSVRSERQLVVEIQFNLLARWFVGLPLDHAAWDATTFSKNRKDQRLLVLSALFFERHLDFLRAANLLSSDHLSVDGTLLQAWASQKSLVPRADLDDDGKPPAPPKGGRNEWVDFKGTTRSNKTHVSATDKDARLASKGDTPRLSHELNVLAENRNNFVVGFSVDEWSGTSEREAAAALVRAEAAKGRCPKTLGGDKKYSDGDALVLELDAMGVHPHFSVRDDRPNALARIFHDEPGFPVSVRKRMRIEEQMSYVKTVANLRQVKVRLRARVAGVVAIALAAANITRRAGMVTC